MKSKFKCQWKMDKQQQQQQKISIKNTVWNFYSFWTVPPFE